MNLVFVLYIRYNIKDFEVFIKGFWIFLRVDYIDCYFGIKFYGNIK